MAQIIKNNKPKIIFKKCRTGSTSTTTPLIPYRIANIIKPTDVVAYNVGFTKEDSEHSFEYVDTNFKIYRNNDSVSLCNTNKPSRDRVSTGGGIYPLGHYSDWAIANCPDIDKFILDKNNGQVYVDSKQEYSFLDNPAQSTDLNILSKGYPNPKSIDYTNKLTPPKSMYISVSDSSLYDTSKIVSAVKAKLGFDLIVYSTNLTDAISQDSYIGVGIKGVGFRNYSDGVVKPGVEYTGYFGLYKLKSELNAQAIQPNYYHLHLDDMTLGKDNIFDDNMTYTHRVGSGQYGRVYHDICFGRPFIASFYQYYENRVNIAESNKQVYYTNVGSPLLVYCQSFVTFGEDTVEPNDPLTISINESITAPYISRYTSTVVPSISLDSYKNKLILYTQAIVKGEVTINIKSEPTTTTGSIDLRSYITTNDDSYTEKTIQTITCPDSSYYGKTYTIPFSYEYIDHDNIHNQLSEINRVGVLLRNIPSWVANGDITCTIRTIVF